MRWRIHAGRFGDFQMESLLGALLRAGVLLAATVAAIGSGLFMFSHGFVTADFRVFRGEPVELRTISGIARATTDLNPLGIMQLGLLILMATPVFRVALSLLAFAFRKDWIYILVTLVVLTLLAYSIAGGFS